MASTAVDPALRPVRAATPPGQKSEAPRPKPHITDLPITLDNWYKHVNWLNVTFIIGIPIMGCIAAAYTPLRIETAIWSVVYYFATGLGMYLEPLMRVSTDNKGITAGYHRLWAHKSYSASLPLEVFLALVGGASIEGSIRWWSRDQ
jgi:stearoyl-CoA desaturase (delta-9 desaturase)